MQQLSWLLWIRTTGTATPEQLALAIEDLLDQNNILFQSETENLSAYQMNFLKAIIDGVHSKFSSKEIISKYNQKQEDCCINDQVCVTVFLYVARWL